MAAPLHPREDERLAALRATGILDTPRSRRFERLVVTAAASMDVPIAAISLIDSDRQWFKASVGLADRETHRDHAFCAFTILQSDVLVVENALEDTRFADNALVTGDPHIRFYAGIPLLSADGLPLGALCVVDTEPRKLSPEQTRFLFSVAREAEELLDGFATEIKAPTAA